MKILISTATGLHDTPQEAIDAAWSAKSIKMDWLGLENTLRVILQTAPNDQCNQVTSQISEALAAFTKRGGAGIPSAEFQGAITLRTRR